MAEDSLVRVVRTVHLVVTVQLNGQTPGQIPTGDMAGGTGVPATASSAGGGHTEDRVLVRVVLNGARPAVLLPVAEPALHDAFAGAGAGELAGRAGGRGAAGRLVRPVQAVRRAVAVPPPGNAFGPVRAGKLVLAAGEAAVSCGGMGGVR